MTDLPLLLAGPIVRRFTATQLNIWLVTSQPVRIDSQLQKIGTAITHQQTAHQLSAAKHAHTYLLQLNLSEPLSPNDVISYDLIFNTDQDSFALTDLCHDICYPEEDKISLCYQPQLSTILHGSCRKPHHPGSDGLAIADKRITHTPIAERPALLMMSGDQIYADDVAGPMLQAIHQIIDLLEFPNEPLSGSAINCASELYTHSNNYYARDQLLPDDKPASDALKRLFKGVRKPVFTSDSAQNHLITFAEVFTMYLLVWSPQLWQFVQLEPSEQIPAQNRERFKKEKAIIECLSDELFRVQRLMAHIPSYMIFDDHDVTDDWNLTRSWEETAYGNPFAREMIGNALIGYWLCQGWGNNPDAFSHSWLTTVCNGIATTDPEQKAKLIDAMLHFDQWHYSVPTSPTLIVLDTRTHRWRSESDANKPSGLMDWPALTELQNQLINEPSVLLISPAPIFGVKLIEMIQRIFTYLGKPLLVDAENWMAHKGSANVILNIFQHPKTPENFIILSGDVHYSFAYDIRLRSHRSSPKIWQITCSGLKNEFPAKLLHKFDRLNTIFYGSQSPLNWLTKRRRMHIRARKVSTSPDCRLNLGNGIGHLTLNSAGQPEKISVWMAEEEIEFIATKP